MMNRLLGRFQPTADPIQTKIKVGICAMDKKARSKPMVRILERMMAFGEFQVIHFGDDVILNQSAEQWPLCDCLISWFSDGFPLKKAQAYVQLRKVATINDLAMQDVIQDRTLVYKTLLEHKIPVPKHIIVERDGLLEGADPEGFLEDPDYVEMDGVRISKPFVEKPADGEDHNIYIYYPASMGGGVKRLFRKVDNKSSQYDATHPGTIRRDGTYIIEEFLATGGTDVKVYTVGPSYAHAEARKSPVVDGKVMRTTDGKEMRFPVLLSPQEKDMAFRVVHAFKQKVCGFDLLRTTSASGAGVSFVCDVNGWSFVKNSKRYLDDAAGILRSIILGMVAPHRLAAAPHPVYVVRPSGLGSSTDSFVAGSGISMRVDGMQLGMADDDVQVLQKDMFAEDGAEVDIPGLDWEEAQHTEDRSATEELRCVLAVIRHGDRTPKQKLKIRVTDAPLLAMFEKYKDAKGKQAKMKTPLQLQDLLDTTITLLADLERQAGEADAPTAVDECDAQAELREKLRIVKTVLEQGTFAGVNRKVQLKPLRWRAVPTRRPSFVTPETSVSSDVGAAPQGTDLLSLLPLPRGVSPPPGPSPYGMQRQGSVTVGGFGRSSIMRAPEEEDVPAVGPAKRVPVLEEALLILKWGGVLTHAGRQQAEDLGKVFRMVMYPRYGSAGGGLLRLHSTYRHDLKIYSSDEGRVQVSAAAFVKGLLDLEGSSLTPILVSLVNKDVDMLEAFGKGASDDIKAAKHLVYSAMTWDPEGGAAGAFKHPYPPPPSMPMSSSMRAAAAAAASAAAAGAGPAGAAAAGAAAGAEASATTAAAAQADSDSAAEELTEGEVAASSAAVARKEISVFPTNPLSLLHQMNALLQGLVGRLRTLCLQGAQPTGHPRYSSLQQESSEWRLDEVAPCSGEQMLLMFDRWRKLSRSFYSEKKETFDISKVCGLQV
ncbi:hypothetical protein FOA52_014597 [Chlamydomonas sp. UWO 241]|nr:hypothetical protein FOA52_014597 [Chlamydomonas sp. UWO 241]